MSRTRDQGTMKTGRGPGDAMALPITVTAGSLKAMNGGQQHLWSPVGQKLGPIAQGTVADLAEGLIAD